MNTGVDSISEIQHMRAKASDFIELTKPGLTSLVLFTTLAGFYLGCRDTIPFVLLLHTLIGTTLMAGSASAFNMYMERKLDALMKRTSGRPLAAGRLKPVHALLFALTTVLGGFWCLYFRVNPLTSLLAALILLSYLFLYTPLKKNVAVHAGRRCSRSPSDCNGMDGSDRGNIRECSHPFRNRLPLAASSFLFDRLDAPGGLCPSRNPRA